VRIPHAANAPFFLIDAAGADRDIGLAHCEWKLPGLCDSAMTPPDRTHDSEVPQISVM